MHVLSVLRPGSWFAERATVADDGIVRKSSVKVYAAAVFMSGQDVMGYLEASSFFI